MSSWEPGREVRTTEEHPGPSLARWWCGGNGGCVVRQMRAAPCIFCETTSMTALNAAAVSTVLTVRFLRDPLLQDGGSGGRYHFSNIFPILFQYFSNIFPSRG